uniref:Secreted protein n=1 Tax=Knipowitschia caucasica TaxID=637954 RepID=A0AAV2KHP2_KNICA
MWGSQCTTKYVSIRFLLFLSLSLFLHLPASFHFASSRALFLHHYPRTVPLPLHAEEKGGRAEDSVQPASFGKVSVRGGCVFVSHIYPG